MDDKTGFCPACRHRTGKESESWVMKPLEGHHLKFRSRGGEKGPLVMLCRECHQAVHDHRGEWTAFYRISSWEEGG